MRSKIDNVKSFVMSFEKFDKRKFGDFEDWIQVDGNFNEKLNIYNFFDFFFKSVLIKLKKSDSKELQVRVFLIIDQKSVQESVK